MIPLFHPADSLRRGNDPIVLGAAEAGWDYCGLSILHLRPGEDRAVPMAGTEGALVPLEGECTLELGTTTSRLAGRDSVFSGVPDVAYLPLDAEARISAPSGGRFAVATAVATERRPHFVHRARDVAVDLRGAGRATRRITGLLSADLPGPQRLIVVEVLTPGGNWSSFPPHKHDEWAQDEVPIEEIYYFEIDGPDGFGFHRTYTDDGSIDETVTVSTGDVFCVPRGFHGPCAAAPGHDMYYLNVMAGPDPERRWLICNDPRHAWIIDTWVGMEPDPRLERSDS